MGASNATKTKGDLWVVAINPGGYSATPNWITIVSQSTCKFSFKNKTEDVTGKEDNGWDATIPGNTGWTLAMDGFIVLSDTGYQTIETALQQTQACYIQVTRPDGKAYQGNAVLAGFDLDLSVGKVAAFSVSFTGDQALTSFPI
jgi:predicted secreted protein